MAEGSSDSTECGMAIEHVARNILSQFPQYPLFADEFQRHCIEEAFEDIDVLIDDVSEGFDESVIIFLYFYIFSHNKYKKKVIMESVAENIAITQYDKEPLCKAVHHLLRAFVSPHSEPLSLELNQLNTDCLDTLSDEEIDGMRKSVSTQAKLLEPNTDDISIFIVLLLGEQNNFPLLSYLVNMYQRYRLSEYFRHCRQNKTFHDIKVNDFFQCDAMKELSINNKILLWYKHAMKACVHRHGLFHSLPLIPSQITNKINDSFLAFISYSISALQAINSMMSKSEIPFPAQIDFWIIPRNIENSYFDDAIYDEHSSYLYDDEENMDEESMNNEDIEQHSFSLKDALNLNNCKNLRQRIVSTLDIEELTDLFGNVIKNVMNSQCNKRMVMILDRRRNGDEKKHDAMDILYAYLPTNTQNIPKYKYLYESMINMTKTEILSSEINANSDILNMFILSLHIHRNNEVSMFWHYQGSNTKFYATDMVNLWPLYFIVNKNKNNKSDDYDLAISLFDKYYILKDKYYHKLIDPNFAEFYELNTKCSIMSYSDYRPKPQIIAPKIDKSKQKEIRIKQYNEWQKEEERYNESVDNNRVIYKKHQKYLHDLYNKQYNEYIRKIKKKKINEIKIKYESLNNNRIQIQSNAMTFSSIPKTFQLILFSVLLISNFVPFNMFEYVWNLQ